MRNSQIRTDVYPVGWLAVLLGLRRAYGAHVPADVRSKVRGHAWRRIRQEAQYTARRIRRREWRAAKNSFNGYLAEPNEFPPGDYVRRCGTGWTKARALRSLDRRLPSTDNRPKAPGVDQ